MNRKDDRDSKKEERDLNVCAERRNWFLIKRSFVPSNGRDGKSVLGRENLRSLCSESSIHSFTVADCGYLGFSVSTLSHPLQLVSSLYSRYSLQFTLILNCLIYGVSGYGFGELKDGQGKIGFKISSIWVDTI
ncbi:hypothetical protein F0562_019500 [Nyssa sinensis]|uniref:Uncharacterized protein n=1 Tax=Nyssa sinensis TaxID=561372 RepID=A0A5J5BQ31_9ASTE|nr:hypothetical protein F0562_019500 [Nyssa sinensis]